jgi:pSer/pThr/pTyr-binding forkhead associated (FHA) protein
MVICPLCNKSSLEGTLFCPECGTQVFASPKHPDNQYPATLTQPEQTSQFTRMKTGELKYLEGLPFEAQAMLRLLETEQIFPIFDGENSVGRVINDQSMLPNIDLTNHGGFETGVSRYHAIITISGQEATITDLGSTNGTRVNGYNLLPHQPHPLNDGDRLQFGKLHAQILFNV